MDPGVNKAHAGVYALMAYQQFSVQTTQTKGSDPMGQQMKEKMEREAAAKVLKDVQMDFEITASENELNDLFEAARGGLADRDVIFCNKVRDTIDRLEDVVREVVADRDQTVG